MFSKRYGKSLSFRFCFRHHAPHQRGPPIIRNETPYPEFHAQEEIYQPQTRYEELPRLPPIDEIRDTGKNDCIAMHILSKMSFETVFRSLIE